MLRLALHRYDSLPGDHFRVFREIYPAEDTRTTCRIRQSPPMAESRYFPLGRLHGNIWRSGVSSVFPRRAHAVPPDGREPVFLSRSTSREYLEERRIECFPT